MSADRTRLDGLAALRAEFDGSFARPRGATEAPGEPVLLLGAGGETCALALGAVAGLTADREIVAVPSRVPAFLGLAGIRGRVVPVWSAARLLGLPNGEGRPRWLVLLGAGTADVALAFERFEGSQRAELPHPGAGAAASGPLALGGGRARWLDPEFVTREIDRLGGLPPATRSRAT